MRLIFFMILVVAYASARPQAPEARIGNVKPQYHTSEDDNLQVIEIPYVGGAKGQVLILTKNAEGEVVSSKIRPVETNRAPPVITQQEPANGEIDFKSELRKVYETAGRLISLQESASATGMNLDGNEEYSKQLEILNEATKNLEILQDRYDPAAPSPAILPISYGLYYNPKSQQSEFRGVHHRFQVGNRNGAVVAVQSADDSIEENTEDNKEQGHKDDNNEGVAVELPPEDASVAEAKPVGLAIAGPGGVAASKPVGTAVVGPGGLAISRPVATAIAGVPPSQVGLPFGSLKNPLLPQKSKKKKNKNKNKNDESAADVSDDDEEEVEQEDDEVLTDDIYSGLRRWGLRRTIRR